MDSMLIEVINDGEKIILMDGSEWYINPGDMPTVCTWIPTSELKVTKTKLVDYFNYKITNMSIDVSVYAARLK
jgi:hypothetical protein